MRKSFFASDAKTHSLDLKSQENAIKKACENPAMLACDANNRGVFQDRAMRKRLRFGLPLRFGLRCEYPRCQIASDVGRAMRTTKLGVKFPGPFLAGNYAEKPETWVPV